VCRVDLARKAWLTKYSFPSAADETGDYQVAGLPLPRGGRFNMSKPKTQVEWEIYRAKHVRLPTCCAPGIAAGHSLSDSKRVSLRVGALHITQLPGPADYGAPALPQPGAIIHHSLHGVACVPASPLSMRVCVVAGRACCLFFLAGGGRFSTANPKSQLDWVRYFAKQLPSPADYGAPKLPKPGGGRFSEANPKSEIEWLQYFAKQVRG